MVASEAILEVFFHGTTTQLTDYLGRLMKMAIINVLERFKTLLVDTQPPHLFSKRYTDLVLLLESLPFSVWEIQDESTLEQIAATITCSFPFIATLLYAASLYHKHRSSTLVFPSMGLQDKEHYT